MGTITGAIYYADSAGKPTGAALQSVTALMLNILATGANWNLEVDPKLVPMVRFVSNLA